MTSTGSVWGSELRREMSFEGLASSHFRVCVCVHVSFLVWKDADEKSGEKIKNVILEDDERVSAMWKVKVILIQIIISKGIQQS